MKTERTIPEEDASIFDDPTMFCTDYLQPALDYFDAEVTDEDRYSHEDRWGEAWRIAMEAWRRDWRDVYGEAP